jgi:hypothetical protein
VGGRPPKKQQSELNQSTTKRKQEGKRSNGNESRNEMFSFIALKQAFSYSSISFRHHAAAKGEAGFPETNTRANER